MEIVELHAITPAQCGEILSLMQELDPEIAVTPEMLTRAAESAATHLFVLNDGGRIIGTASLGVYDSPTGRKVHVEDVVVASAFRGRHLGRKLLEHLLGFVRENIGPADVFLTSRPQRVEANALYRSLNFQRKETNVYKMKF